MIPPNFPKAKVLVFLVITVQILLSVEAVSKSKTKSSKSKSTDSSTSQRQRSGHQYAPLLLKPSKPDPHFDVLDEQRGINYQSRHREGRGGSEDRKPTKLREVLPASLSKASTSSNSAIQYSRKDKKGKSRSSAISSSSSSVETAFFKKSDEVVERARSQPKFSGSQLISGDAGQLTYSMRTEMAEKDGWKILRGPSVSPEEPTALVDRSFEIQPTFTSLTDGSFGNHRTITKLGPVKRGKSITTNSDKYYDDMNDISTSKKVSKLVDAEQNASTSRVRKRTSERNNMQVSIPKQTFRHKYTTITKRVPSRYANRDVPAESSAKKTQKSKPTQSAPKLLRPSKLISTKSSLEARYDSIENDINRMSPVMTLDTKKIVIEPIGTSAEPTALAMPSSMSTEAFSGEQEPTASSSSHKMESRYDQISFPMRDMSIELVDGNHDWRDNDFQTKTALASAEFPLISVSSSMKYPSKKNRRDETGGIITASSFSNQHHHVDAAASEPQFPEFRPMPTSNLAELHEPGFKSPFFDDSDSLYSTPPPSPHVEFVGVGSKIPVVPPPFLGSVGTSRLPLDNGRHKSKLTLSSDTPLELPHQQQPNFHFQGSLVPSDNSVVTLGRYPHFSVGASKHPPGFPDNLPGLSEPVSSNIHPFPLGQQPMPGYGHRSHLVIHPSPHHRPHHHLHPRHSPPPIPLGHIRQSLVVPLEVGSGRKAPPSSSGDLPFETGKILHTPPPPPGIDPYHPAVQHAFRNPHTILNDGIFIEPTDSTNIQETTKKYLHNLQYQVHRNTLVPLDKRLVCLFMIFSWMFWLTTFYTYYRYTLNGNKAKQIVLNVPKDGENPQVAARALDTTSQWNFTKVLEYIEIAQKTYEGFDWQDLECQKRTLCELVQKQNEPWGETGRKMANSYIYRIMDALDGVPIPQLIQTYLKQYKEAVSQGKNSSKDCGQVYAHCKFSIKEVLNKAAAKKKA